MFGPCVPDIEEACDYGNGVRDVSYSPFCSPQHIPNIWTQSLYVPDSGCGARMTQDRMLETRELCEQSTRSVTLLVQTTTTR